jgi:hypothetical protein
MGRAPLQFGVILWRVMRPRVLIAVKQTSMQQLVALSRFCAMAAMTRGVDLDQQVRPDAA